MRGTYVMRKGRLVRKEKATPLNRGPMTISDDIGSDLEHHAFSDGRKTASKSEFRRWTKEAGCIEKGNDRERPRAAQNEIRSDVGRAIQMVREGYRPQLKMIEGYHG